jgi:hypothetical protein
MLFKRKQVLCSNCGFLCWYIQHASGEGPYRLEEVRKRARNDFQAGTFNGTSEDQETEEDYQFHCLRRQWVWAPGSKLRPDYVEAEDVRKKRQCVYYIEYQPAFGPEEHKELKREAETRATILRAALLGALIGAAAAIIAQLLYAFFVPFP